MSNLVISTELANAIDKLVKGEIAVQKAKAQVVEVAKNQGVTFSRDGAYLEKMPIDQYKELTLLLAAQYGKQVVSLMSKTESEAGDTTVAFQGSHVNGTGRNARPTHWRFWWSMMNKKMKQIELGIYNAQNKDIELEASPDGQAGQRNLPFSMRSLKLYGEAYKYLANVDPVKVDDNADITQALATLIKSGAAIGLSAEKIRGYGDKS